MIIYEINNKINDHKQYKVKKNEITEENDMAIKRISKKMLFKGVFGTLEVKYGN